VNTTAPPARLKTRYLEEIRPALVGRFGYSSIMQAPKLEKITVNMGVGLAKQDSKVLKAALEQLATIAGQQPSVRRARKSIAAFKLREGMPVGVAVTLRAERGYEFLDRLVSIAIPRIRDFRGLNPRSFDGRGNYSLGVREQIIFPEIDYDAIDMVRGLDITITTSAATDAEAFALLSAMGMPFAAQGRPAGFDLPGEESEDVAPEPAAAAPTEPQDAVAAETAAPAEREDAAEAAAPAEVEDAVETADPAETEDAVEQPADAAPAEPEDAAPAEVEEGVEQPAEAPPAEPEAAVETAPPAATEDAVEKPEDAAPAEAEKASEKPKAAKKPAKPKRKAKPKATAEDAPAEAKRDTADSADGDTAEKESTD
jgi:large subunit ribosomal protein L5